MKSNGDVVMVMVMKGEDGRENNGDDVKKEMGEREEEW